MEDRDPELRSHQEGDAADAGPRRRAAREVFLHRHNDGHFDDADEDAAAFELSEEKRLSMNLALLLEMAADAVGERVAVSAGSTGLTYLELLSRARSGAAALAGAGAAKVGLIAVNSPAVPVTLFAASLAGLPYAPLNYRLAEEQLAALAARLAPGTVVVDDDMWGRLPPIAGLHLLPASALVEPDAEGWAPPEGGAEPDSVAVLLFTSGTTGEPKAALLRHAHLSSYVLSTVDFMSAGAEEATLVSVPPYHVAGIAAVLSSVYAGRRIVYLPSFAPGAWVATARAENITHAMVVPTMLGRILDVLEHEGAGLPALRHLSYGGGRMPVAVVERAMALLPEAGFVNAYGLTETSSSVTVLGPDEHRAAFASDDPAVRARLGSVGRPLPDVELEIRDPMGRPRPPRKRGEVWVRGGQVSGEYEGRPPMLTADGWFATNDQGWLDVEGYLYVEGRLDDVIVRGAENISPGEVEDVLIAHPGVAEAAVFGVPDEEWGETVVAAVVPAPSETVSEADLQEWVRARLRSSRTPARIEFRSELPYNETGKLLRRVLRAELAAG